MHMCCAGSSVLYVYNDVCSGGVRKNVTGTGPEKKAQKQKQSTRQEKTRGSIRNHLIKPKTRLGLRASDLSFPNLCRNDSRLVDANEVFLS